MRTPILDAKEQEEIQREIERLAKAYTPEWKPDFAHPDAGTVLAKLFAQMHCGTIRRLNRFPEVGKTAFYNFIGTELRPAEAASGYVQFQMAEDTEDADAVVPEGTVVTADLPQQEQNGFTTLDTVCVTNAKIMRMILTDGAQDAIRDMYTYTTEKKVPSFFLFHSDSENQNAHMAWIGCKGEMLRLRECGTIRLFFTEQSGQPSAEPYAAFLERAFLQGELEISISAESGWQRFSFCRAQEQCLILEKTADMPPVAPMEQNQETCIWIRLTWCGNRPPEDLPPQKPTYAVSGNEILPDVLLSKDGISEDINFYPFGEMPALYDCCHIGSDEVFGKVGAHIFMRFTVEYEPLPKYKPVEKPVKDWKWIMKKSEIRQEEFEIAFIRQVTWEYFNGNGWKALPCSAEMKTVFSPADGKRLVTLEFFCPLDIRPALVEAEERYFIRARVSRMEQSFRLQTIYRAPVLSDVTLSYRYDTAIPFDAVYTENNMERKRPNPSEPMVFFSALPQRSRMMYLCLSHPLAAKTYRLLATPEKQDAHDMPALRWEYAANTGWKPLHCYDETGGFAHTGFLTVDGNTDFAKQTRFRQEGYWIRVWNPDGKYDAGKWRRKYPWISFLDFNCTEVQNWQRMPPEYFGNDSVTANLQCRLSRGNICTAEVWVNEFAQCGAEEMQRLCRDGIANPIYDSYGVMRQLWVKWKQTDSFFSANAEARVYLSDFHRGVITFGDGVHGKIPGVGKGDRIRVDYTLSGGSAGNVEKGAIHGSRHALGMVTEISNPMSLSGGNDMERLSEAQDRAACEFQNRGRCVTAADYEQVAVQMERSILRVKCIPGYNAERKPEPGCIALLFLRSDFTKEGVHFHQIQEKLRRGFQEICAETLTPGKLCLMHPLYVQICVTAEILVADRSRSYRIQEQVRQKISEFLHPITGNFDHGGWKIGVLPELRQIENAIRSVSGVSFVRNITARGFSAQEREKTEIPLSHMSAESVFYTAVSGEHDIRIVTE